MEDGLFFDREDWRGRRCWFVCGCRYQFGVGVSVNFDDHPDAANEFSVMIGPIKAGVLIYKKEQS